MRNLRVFCLFVLLGALAALPARAETVAGAQAKLNDAATEANALFSLSFFFEQAGRPFSALKAIEKAIEKDGKVPGYHARQGQLLLARKRTREAAAAFGRAADMDPTTKSFRAAQARALTTCSLNLDAATAWEQLLTPATDPKEILDAARNVAGLRQNLGDLAGAEKAWQTAFEKLAAASWDQRLQAANALNETLLREKAADRAVAFWGAWLATETDWPKRSILADNMAKAGQQGASAESREHIRAAWAALLDSAPTPEGKQSAAAQLGELLLKDNRAADALKAVTPLIYGPPQADLRLAVVAETALSEQNDSAALVELWRGVIAAKPVYETRTTAISRLVPLLKDNAAITALRRDAVAAYPGDARAQMDLAQALTAEKKFAAAAQTTYAVFDQAAAGNKNGSRNEMQYWDAVINAYAAAHDIPRVAKLIDSEFQGHNFWQVRNWISTVQYSCGEAAALALAEQLAVGTNGVARVGGAMYLTGAYPDHARVLLDGIGNDAKLPVEDRRTALQQLQQYAVTPADHIALIRRELELNGNFWQHWNEYNQLGMYLGLDGQISEGIDLARSARKIVENNQSAAPQALRALGNGIFQNQIVGRGLRTTNGLATALDATQKFYAEAAADPAFNGCFDDLCRNLADLQARRGNTAGAIDFVHALCSTRENPALRLFAADLISRRSGNNTDALWSEYTAYVDAITHLYAEALRINNQNHYFWNLDERFLQYVAKAQKEKALLAHFDAELLDPKSDRAAVADVLLSYLRGINNPAEMLTVLGRLKTLGVSGPFYTNQQQWAEAAVKMNNAGSRADAQRREQLLHDVDNWKAVFAQNPEDYQAAVNVYKSLQQLGRSTDGKPFLEQALKVAPADPLLLEIHARELMLDKSYGDAAKELKLAADAAGRMDDVEATIASAYELSGHANEALKLALDSLEHGRNNGQGIRTAQQIQDLAERTNGLDFLKTELTARLQAIQQRKQYVSEALAGLALRVSWERNDAALTKLALDAILALAWQPSHNWNNPWEWQQLAQQAQERHRTEDAIRILQALETGKANQGQPPQAYDYQNLASLMLQAGHADDAAELMFGALAQASRANATPGAQPVPWNPEGSIRRDERRGQRNRPPQPAGSNRRAWIGAILEIAAREADGGAETFRKACGDRFAALVDEELKDVTSSALLNVQTAVPLGLRDRVETALRDAANTNLSLATWRLALADYESDHNQPRTVKLDDITAACKAAAEKAEPSERGALQLAIANLYMAEFNRAPDHRIPDLTPEMVLAAYDSAADAEGSRIKLEALRPALQFSHTQKLYSRFLDYAQKLHAAFPDSFADATTLGNALLLNDKTADAVTLLKPYLEVRNLEAQYAQTATLFLTARGEQTDAATALAAADYFTKAIELHQIAVGTQLDGQGKTLPDPSAAEMQSQLCSALALGGKLDAALTALAEAAANDAGNAWRHDRIAALAAIFKQAGKLSDLAAALDAKVPVQPRNVALRLACADVAELAGDDNAALDALSVAKAISPDLATVKRLIAQERKMGKLREALAECKLWAANFQSDEEAHQTLAAIYKDLHDDAGELQALTMLVESAPREAVQCRKVAVMFADRKDFVRARALLERAVELRSEEPYRVIDLAEVCALAGDTARAEQLCTEALARDWAKGLSPELLARMPRWQGTFENRAHSLLADAYQAQGQNVKAAHERMQLPPHYQRPKLADAVPVATAQNMRRL